MNGEGERTKEGSARRWPWAAAIVLAVGWVYWPALRGGWLWDDGLEITANPLVRASAGWWKGWVEPSGLDYYPLKDSLQWLQWHLWGDHPLGYHLTSVGLHLASAFLLWRLLGQLGVRRPWIGGLLFAVHPVAVESVAWISELKNTLSLSLLLLAMLRYLDFDRGQRRSYFWSLVFFLAAMLSKSSVALFPVVLLLYAWWRRGRIAGADACAAAPFWGISLGLGWVTIWFQQHRAIGGGTVGPDLVARVAAAGHAVGFYFGKAVFPLGLMPIYPRWDVATLSFGWVLSWGVVAVALVWFWAKRATWGRHALLGGGWFLANLLPVLGFIPMAYARNSWVADHFAYISLVGIVGLAAAAVAAAADGGPGRRVFGQTLPVVLAVALAVQSRRHAGIFRDEPTLWNETLRLNPDAWLAHNNLGKLALEKGEGAEAISQLEAAVRLEPDSAEAHANLGNALLKAERQAEALDQYREALRLAPAFAGAHYDFGSALLQAGRPSEALGHFAEAVRIDPSYAAAQNNWGLALARIGRISEAIVHYQAALVLRPAFPEARVNLGNGFFNLGRLPEAVAEYQAALRIDPGYSAAHRNLGYAWRALGRTAEAEAEFEASGRR